MEYLQDFQELLKAEWLKNLFAAAATIIGLFAFGKGVVEFIKSNAIRRYEKFHEMSVRFDENPKIQLVCKLLHGVNNSIHTVTTQDKEVFICFLEEIYFMMNSRIMKQDLALYTFGYYGKLALRSEEFWHGLNRLEPSYMHFLSFCRLAKSYVPARVPDRRKLTY
jgi:hypothetical protein